MSPTDAPTSSVQQESERRILYLTTNDIAEPTRGCDRRSHQLWRWLGNWNHVCSVAYSKTTEGRSKGSESDYSIRYPRSKLLAPFDPYFLARIVVLRTDSDFDWVVASGLGSFLYGIFAASIFGSRLVVDLHNAEHVLSKDLGDLPHYLLAVSIGELALRLADVVVFTSENDREHYPDRVRRKSVIVSNGFDSNRFSPGETEEGKYLLFFGNMEYQPNEEAVKYIARQVAPKVAESAHETEILIVGPHCDEIRDEIEETLPVEVVGLVGDIADYVTNARAVIVPLRKGSGTRLKIIESLACGTPVIATPKGAEGWPDDWKNLRTTELGSFSESVISFLDSRVAFDDDELRAYDEYSWRRQVKKLNREMDSGGKSYPANRKAIRQHPEK